MSIFHTPSPGKATREGQSVSAVTGRKDMPKSNEAGVSVKHVPNSGGRK